MNEQKQWQILLKQGKTAWGERDFYHIKMKASSDLILLKQGDTHLYKNKCHISFLTVSSPGKYFLGLGSQFRDELTCNDINKFKQHSDYVNYSPKTTCMTRQNT